MFWPAAAGHAGKCEAVGKYGSFDGIVSFSICLHSCVLCTAQVVAWQGNSVAASYCIHREKLQWQWLWRLFPCFNCEEPAWEAFGGKWPLISVG